MKYRRHSRRKSLFNFEMPSTRRQIIECGRTGVTQQLVLSE